MVKHHQTICRLLPTNCLSVFGHFVGLALKVLRCSYRWESSNTTTITENNGISPKKRLFWFARFCHKQFSGTFLNLIIKFDCNFIALLSNLHLNLSTTATIISWFLDNGFENFGRNPRKTLVIEFIFIKERAYCQHLYYGCYYAEMVIHQCSSK